MNRQVDPTELLAAQRGLRDRLLGPRNAAPLRELAAEMLLYIDDVQGCWRTCSNWLLGATHADRVDAGYCASSDTVYRPGFELMRHDGVVPTVLGVPMNTFDSGIAMVWASSRPVVFADIATDRRLGASMRSVLLAAGTRRKLAVALRDGAHEVGLLCVDSASTRDAWRADQCERLDAVARDVIAPILRVVRQLGAADPEPNDAGSSPVGRLTPAELKVAHWVLAGCSYKEIARRLDRSPSTIDHQLRSMRDKLGVASTAKLMRELTALLPASGGPPTPRKP